MKLSTFYEFLNPSIYDDSLFKEESIENGHSTTETDWKGKEVTDAMHQIMTENAKLFYTPEEEQSGKVDRVLRRLELLGFQIVERFPHILHEKIVVESVKDREKENTLEKECIEALEKVLKWNNSKNGTPRSAHGLVQSLINVYDTEKGKPTKNIKEKEEGTKVVSQKIYYRDRVILRFQYHTIVSECAEYWNCRAADCFMLARFVQDCDGKGTINEDIKRAHVGHVKDANLKKKLFSSPHVKKSTIKELNDLDYIVWSSIGVGSDKKLGPIKTYKEAKTRLAKKIPKGTSRFSY